MPNTTRNVNKIPLLFLIYANDVPDSVFFSICFSYADDLKLLHNEPNVNTGRLEDDLKRLESWCSFNKLFLNAKKCFLLNVRNCPINLTIGEEAMRSLDYVEDLRLITNAKLSWTNHIEYRIKKAHGFYQFCRRNTSKALSMLHKLDLYLSTILPFEVGAFLGKSARLLQWLVFFFRQTTISLWLGHFS